MSLDKDVVALRRVLGGAPEKRALSKLHIKVKKRIFVDGLDASSRQIGVYSERYAKLRESKGLTGGRVILVFTGQMKDAFVLTETSSGYMSGFNDFLAAAKAQFVTSTYDTEIFDLTPEEEDFIEDELQKEVNRTLNV